MSSFDVMKAETVRTVSGSDEFAECVGLLAKLQQIAPKITVVDEGSKAMASETILQVKNTEKRFEELRKTAKAPFLEMGKTIDNVFKPLIAACEGARKSLEGQVLQYNAAARAALELSQKQAMEKEIKAREVDGEKPPDEYPLFYPGVTQTDSGKTFTRTRLKFEVVDEVRLIKAALDKRNQIPLTVATVNESKLRECVNGKLYSIKNWAKYGVRVYEVEEVVAKGE